MSLMLVLAAVGFVLGLAFLGRQWWGGSWTARGMAAVFLAWVLGGLAWSTTARPLAAQAREVVFLFTPSDLPVVPVGNFLRPGDENLGRVILPREHPAGGLGAWAEQACQQQRLLLRPDQARRMTLVLVTDFQDPYWQNRLADLPDLAHRMLDRHPDWDLFLWIPRARQQPVALPATLAAGRMRWSALPDLYKAAKPLWSLWGIDQTNQLLTATGDTVNTDGKNEFRQETSPGGFQEFVEGNFCGANGVWDRQLGEGFHYIDWHPQDGSPSPAHTACFFQTRARRLIVAARSGGGLDDLSVQTWRDHRLTTTPAAVDLTKFFLTSRSGEYAGTLGFTYFARQSILNDAGPPVAFAELTPERLGYATSLALLDPGEDDLAQLEEKLHLSQRIRAGLNVAVFGPPVRPDAENRRPVWIPAWAQQAGSAAAKSPQVVNTDRRLYLCFDNRRSVLVPARDSAAVAEGRTAAEFQRRLLEKLRLGSFTAGTSADSGWILVPPAGPPIYQAFGGGADDRWLVQAAPTVGPAPGDSAAYGALMGSEPALEDLPGHLGLRLQLLAQPSASVPQPVTLTEHYVRAFVLLCVLDQPQSGQGPAGADVLMTRPSGVNLHPAAAAAPAPTAALDLWRHAGLQFLSCRLSPGAFYQLPPDSTHGELELKDVLAAHAGETAPAPPILLAALNAAGLETAVNNTAAAIRQRLHALAPASNIVVKSFGRVLDPRLKAAGRPAPERYRPLRPEATRGDDVEVNAEVDTTGQPVHDPLVCSASWGEGRVICYGYSPFAADMWLPDSLDDNLADLLRQVSGQSYLPAGSPARWNPADATANGAQDGWGQQRLLDLPALTTVPNPAGQTMPLAMELIEGEAGLRLTVRAAADAAPPSLGLHGGAPLRLIAWNLLAGEAVYYVPADAAGGILQIDVLETPGHPARLLTRANVPPRNLKDIAQFKTGRAALLDWADEAGAVRVEGLHPPPEETEASRPRAIEQIVTLALGFAIFLIVCWWRSLADWWSGRRKQRLAPVSPDLSPTNAEASFIETGYEPGHPTGRRQPGEPDAIRRYRTGDSLMRALPSSLVGFTALGRRLGLPARLPRTRQRRLSQSYPVELWLDFDPALAVPATPGRLTKADLANTVVQVLALSGWRRGAVTTVKAMQDSAHRFGPAAAGSAGDLGRWIAATYREGGRAGVPDPTLMNEAEPGAAIYFVSDFQFMADAFLEELLTWSSHQQVSVFLCLVADAAETAASGLVLSARTGRFHDRSAVSEGLLAVSIERHAARLESRAKTAVPIARFARVELTENFPAMVHTLVNQGFLE